MGVWVCMRAYVRVHACVCVLHSQAPRQVILIFTNQDAIAHDPCANLEYVHQLHVIEVVRDHPCVRQGCRTIEASKAKSHGMSYEHYGISYVPWHVSSVMARQFCGMSYVP